MSDIEKWKEFLTSFGIEFTEEEVEEGVTLLNIDNIENPGMPTGFFTQITFDENGKFMEIGAFG